MARKNHRQRIHDMIYQRILEGDVKPDERLVDTQIAKEQGVSRMPVREALLQLVNEGYLESTTRGFMLPNLSPKRIQDIFLLRQLLEPHAVASATQIMDEKTLVLLRSAVAETTISLTQNDFMSFYSASEIFRNGWIQMIPNEELRSAILRYSGQVQSVRLATMRDKSVHKIIVTGQQELLDIFERRDAIAAHNRILRFIFEAEEAYNKILSRKLEG